MFFVLGKTFSTMYAVPNLSKDCVFTVDWSISLHILLLIINFLNQVVFRAVMNASVIIIFKPPLQ